MSARGLTPRRARGRGHTLAEVLIAVAIAALALTVLLHVFRESRRSADTARDKSGTLHHARLLLEQLKRDLRAMPAEPPAGEPGLAFSGGRISFPVVLPGEAGGAAERVSWSSDVATGLATRHGSATGEASFGREDARVRRFEIREETGAFPGGSYRRYRVIVALSNGSDDPRSRITLETSVVPPAQSRIGKNAW